MLTIKLALSAFENAETLFVRNGTGFRREPHFRQIDLSGEMNFLKRKRRHMGGIE